MTPTSPSTSSQPQQAVYVLDLNTGKIKWNEALYSVYGYSPTEPASTTEWWTDHIHPEDAMLLNETLDKINNHAIGNWSVEYRMRKADGTYIKVRDQATLMRAADGTATKLVGSLTPVGA